MKGKRRSEKTGLPPGTLVHIGEMKSEHTRIELFHYDESSFLEIELSDISEAFQYTEHKGVVWINIHGLHDTRIVEAIGRHFNLHPLTLEDVMNANQRPKVEDFSSYIFVVLKMLYPLKEQIITEQVSIIFGKNYIISFQEDGADVFNPVREQIRTNKGRLRKMGPDYLGYALIDNIVDNYFGILEKLGEAIEVIEERLTDNPLPASLHAIHRMRRQMVMLRKSVWPLREVISHLHREDSELITAQTSLYLRDVYDHTIQVIDGVETFRDILSGMLDLYLSSVSNRLNQIMKVLTIIATIFMPLTFIVGLYGMNFKYMPELRQWWGYPAVLILMIVIAGWMLRYFKKKKWF